MTAIDFLNKPNKIRKELKALEMELALYNRLSNTLPSQDFSTPRVDHTKRDDAYFEKWNLLAIDKEKEIEAKKKELEKVIIEVKKAIEKMDNPDYRVLLQLRYIENLTFDLIAKKMYISLSTAKRWHREGVYYVEIQRVTNK